MSKRSQDKRRARAKEKQSAKRRQQGQSPLTRLMGEESIECWKMEADGIVSLQVLRPVRGGATAHAGFLIDLDCLGMKDAVLRLDVEVAEFRAMLREQGEVTGDRPVKTTPQEARKLVAAGIRWTLAHSYFSLPAQTEKCCKVLGGTLEIDTADVSDFGTEDGGLYYIGRRRDLERRLVGMTVEEFMEMEDVECEFADAEFDELEREAGMEPEEAAGLAETQDMLEEMTERMRAKMLDKAKQWCFANGQAPHPDLEKAVDLMLTASMESLMAEGGEVDLEEEPTVTAEGTEAAMEAERVLRELETPAERVRLAEAEAQLKGFMDSFKSQKEMLDTLGLELSDLPGDEE